jgi:hypothetical protein
MKVFKEFFNIGGGVSLKTSDMDYFFLKSALYKW